MSLEQYQWGVLTCFVFSVLGALYRGKLSYSALFTFIIISLTWPGYLLAAMFISGIYNDE